MKNKYVVSHDDTRGIWGLGTFAIMPFYTKKQARERLSMMCGKPKMYKLVEVKK